MALSTASGRVSRSSARTRCCLGQTVPRRRPAPPPHALPPLPTPIREAISKLLTSGLAVGLLLSPSPVVAAQPLRTLADVSRPTFGGPIVDLNQDGVITMDEITAMTNQVAEDTGFNQPKNSLLAFTVRLFDLNKDGVLTTEEMLTGMTLNNSVYEEALDADVYKVFDQNGDGRITMDEWKAPFGNLGPHGDDLKEWTFNHVEYLSDANHQLNAAELASALELMRLELLGF